MAIKVYFPSDTDSIIVRGLYQWDYGQTLELELPDIGTEIAEVHFACEGMSEAIVRTCSFVNGLGSVTIPDHCLEQTTPIKAWIFRIDGTQGHTTKVVTLPVNARTRPAKTKDIPQEYVNEYAQLIESVNSLVDELENGNVVVKTANSAKTAENANSAKTANQAGTANYSVTAGTANTAKVANSLQVSRNYTMVDNQKGFENNSIMCFEITSYYEGSHQKTIYLIMDVACDAVGTPIYSPSFDLRFGDTTLRCALRVEWLPAHGYCAATVMNNDGDPMTGFTFFIAYKKLSA